MTAAPPPAQNPQHGTYAQDAERARPARPWPVLVGAILGWLASALLLLGGVGGLVSATNTDPASLMGAMSWAVALTAAVVIVAGLLGGLLTTLAFRGSRGALVALTGLAALCAVLPIAVVLWLLSTGAAPGAPWGILVVTPWAVAVAVLFWAGNSWFRQLRIA